MNYVFYVIAVILEIVIDVELMIMFARALLSWIMPDAEGGIFDVIYYVTEPLVQPVRAILNKLFPALQDFPIDISFFVTTLILGFVGMLIAV